PYDRGRPQPALVALDDRERAKSIQLRLEQRVAVVERFRDANEWHRTREHCFKSVTDRSRMANSTPRLPFLLPPTIAWVAASHKDREERKQALSTRQTTTATPSATRWHLPAS